MMNPYTLQAIAQQRHDDLLSAAARHRRVGRRRSARPHLLLGLGRPQWSVRRHRAPAWQCSS